MQTYTACLMKKTRKIILLALAALLCVMPPITWYVYTNVPMIEFSPVHMGEQQEVQASNTPLTERQADQIEQTLKSYGELARRQDRTTILITWQLSRDQELIWNYTTKSWIDE